VGDDRHGRRALYPGRQSQKDSQDGIWQQPDLHGLGHVPTEDGEAVESEAGQDVYTTSNYVFAQLLDYYGMARESKEVYKKMDKVIFHYGISLIAPDNLRAELEQEDGEAAPGPIILCRISKTGRRADTNVMQHIKALQKANGKKQYWIQNS